MRLAKSERGFSLIEVVIALAILSTAAIGFSELLRGSLEGTKQVERHYLARTVAENEMVRVFTEQAPLRIGVTSGETVQMGQTFAWVQTVDPSAEQDLLLIQVETLDPFTETVLAQISTLKRVGQ